MKVLHAKSRMILATALAMLISPAVVSSQTPAAKQPLHMTSTYSTHSVGRLSSHASRQASSERAASRRRH
jgi:hypothetical protein